MFNSDSQPQETPSTPRLSNLSSAMENLNRSAQSGKLTSLRGKDSVDAGFASPREIVGNILSPGLNESPLSRSGLLQATNYVSSHVSSPGPRIYNVPHSQDDIRSYTMQLSNMAIPKKPAHSVPLPSIPGPSDEESTSLFSPAVTSPDAGMSSFVSPSKPPSSPYSLSYVDLPSSLSSHDVGSVTPRGTSPPCVNPSGLSILLSRQRHSGTSPPSVTSGVETPTTHPRALPPTKNVDESAVHFQKPAPTASHPPNEQSLITATETSALLRDVEASVRTYTVSSPPRPRPPLWNMAPRISVKNIKSYSHVDAKDLLTTLILSLPAVTLGILLNILDGISYGLIIFPTSGIFADLGGLGVSMFFVSTVIAQLVYSAGGSSFAGANGSMMIEVVPFFHIIATSLARDIGEDKPNEVIATTLVAYAFSSILTGLAFFILGALRLGTLIGFFPRHILIGCIGGVGVFLIITGLAVSTRMEEDDFTFSLAMFRYLVLDIHNLMLWLPAFALAALLRVITHKFHHQLIFPLYFIIIPVVFYFVVMVGQFSLQDLRETGWIFTTGDSRDPWYKFYTMFDLKAVHWGPFWSTLPTQFALLFFNVLHPPLNVPALSVSLNEDVDTDKELMAHGYSNFLAGIFGTVPNYLVYVNTLLFYRVGGGTRVAGLLLAAATALLLFIGTGPIAYIPVMVVGSLIFVLGIDLVKEALWDTRHRVNRLEYVTIASIMIFMTAFDFVVGVLFGIVVSCFFFVVQNSQQKSIRALHTGDTAMSTVRRPSAHRAYLREVSKQTAIVRLQGFLFFGTITHVEETIRKLVDGPSWLLNPFRFLVVDLSLVYGVDTSAAEAFVRLQRLLASKKIVLVFCGVTAESMAGRSLCNVGLLDMEGVELFSTYNDAMEWSENVYLRAWFSSWKEETDPVVLPGRQDVSINMNPTPLVSSPRRSQLHDVGWRTIGGDIVSRSPSLNDDTCEPLYTLCKVFSSDTEFDKDKFLPLAPYLERMAVPQGLKLWNQGDESDALYIIESGVLRASYKFAEHIPIIEESMVAGTLAGELSGLSGLERNATVVVERHAVLWKLSRDNLKLLGKENPELAQTFTRLVMRAAKIDYDILLSALATK